MLFHCVNKCCWSLSCLLCVGLLRVVVRCQSTTQPVNVRRNLCFYVVLCQSLCQHDMLCFAVLLRSAVSVTLSTCPSVFCCFIMLCCISRCVNMPCCMLLCYGVVMYLSLCQHAMLYFAVLLRSVISVTVSTCHFAVLLHSAVPVTVSSCHAVFCCVIT